MIPFRITLAGSSLLMHSSRLANPLDPTAKAIKRITDKRKMTDEDHEEKARLEHLGSLYIDDEIGPYLPGENITRCLVDSARITRQGVKVQRGVLIETDKNVLVYSGPRTAPGLWKDENFRHMASVKVGQGRVMRCRPRFANWAAEAEGILDPNELNWADLEEIVARAGRLVGIGDWRPRYGRFTGTLERLDKKVSA